MYLTRHQTASGPRWAKDGFFLPTDFTLGRLLAMSAVHARVALAASSCGENATGTLLAPIEEDQEVWASGVTYLRSRLAREAESQSKDVYQKVYEAERPELFFKSVGWRVIGHDGLLRIRADSFWNVPEPELTLVVNSAGEILGYTVGNDMSSRSIEGENPLYLPQAKIYDGCCGIGPGIRLVAADSLRDLPIQIEIRRDHAAVFSGQTRSSQMKRRLEDLAAFLIRELAFPRGVFLMTGTGIVPTEAFTLQSGDRMRIDIAGLVLENPVQ